MSAAIGGPDSPPQLRVVVAPEEICFMSSFSSLSCRRATKGLIAASMIATLGLPGCGGSSEVGTVKVAAPKGGGAGGAGEPPGATGRAAEVAKKEEGNLSVDPKAVAKDPKSPANARSIKNRPIQ